MSVEPAICSRHPRHPVSGVSFTAMWAEFDGIGASELVPVNPSGLVPEDVLL